MNECRASGDAGLAEVAINLLVSIGGMEQGGSAMEKGDERKSETCVSARLAAELRGETTLYELEGGHRFFASEGHGPVIGDEAAVMGMSGKEIERAPASFHGRM
jgi:hypothetical protein